MSTIIPITGLKLIGIHGHAGTGKDTIAAYLYNNYQNVYGESFADPLKEACAAAFGIDPEDFYDPDVKEIVNDYWGASPRQIAQFIGTELFRTLIGNLLSVDKSFWIKRLSGRLTGVLAEYKDHPYVLGDCVVISDVRFQNEYEWIIQSGGIVIHVTRAGKDGSVGITNHASESKLNLHLTEATFHVENNSTLTALYEKIDAIVCHRLERKEDNFPL